MKAIRQRRYGSPDTLALCEVEPPTPVDGQVLVRVEAASLHRGDCFVMRGAPFVVRFMTGLLRPKRGVPGFDLAGRVVSVGEGVQGFAPGDDVFGTAEGTCTEYVCAKAKEIAPKPANLDFGEAASIPTSALAALHALRDAAAVQAGQRVLIIGAAGGVGTFAVQIAKSLGAEVTALGSTKSLDMLRELGADHVVDYTEQDVTDLADRYDLVLDVAGAMPLRRMRRLLTDDGCLVTVGGPAPSGWFGGVGRVLGIALTALLSRRQTPPFVSSPTTEDLRTLRELAATGQVVPVVDEVFPLDDAVEAIAAVGAGHNRGTTVLVA